MNIHLDSRAEISDYHFILHAEIPRALLEQLKCGGRMLIPVGPQRAQQHLMQIDRQPDGQWMQTKISGTRGEKTGLVAMVKVLTTSRYIGVQYVPLTTVEKQWGKIQK